MPTKYLIIFSLLFLAGCYVRHWMHTGSGQFRRLNELMGGDW